MSETYYRAEDVRRIIGDGFVLTKNGCEWTSKLFDQISAADVEPVRYAEWKLIGADKLGRGGIWECTGLYGCGKSFPLKCDYCPNCGAKMDLEG